MKAMYEVHSLFYQLQVQSNHNWNASSTSEQIDQVHKQEYDWP